MVAAGGVGGPSAVLHLLLRLLLSQLLVVRLRLALAAHGDRGARSDHAGDDPFRLDAAAEEVVEQARVEVVGLLLALALQVQAGAEGPVPGPRRVERHGDVERHALRLRKLADAVERGAWRGCADERPRERRLKSPTTHGGCSSP